MTNGSNKRRLQIFIKDFLSQSEVRKKFLYCDGGNATFLELNEDIEDFAFSHEEAYTTIFSAYAKLCSNGITAPVIADSGDTDAYILATFVSHKIQCELYIKQKKKTEKNSHQLSNHA